MIGQRLSHYQIEEKIGTGGMGDVYKALDTDLQRSVAVKVLPAELASHPMKLDLFRQEARAIASVNHSNIVTIHSVDRQRETHFIVMELIQGRELTEILEESGLPLGPFFDIAISLADAIAAAHAQGVIHRDLKPSNIMINDDGHVKVLDFGLAKLIPVKAIARGDTLEMGSPVDRNTILGTPNYMSPEQVRGGLVDSRTDIFSLGVIYYEMITGRRPFDGEVAADLMVRILRDDPVPAHIANPACPLLLSQLIGRCLEKEPDHRLPSVRGLYEDLRQLKSRLLSGESERIRTIAVLPFADLSPARDQKYFCDGIAEEIINALTKIEGLKVVSRMSAFQYRELGGDSREVGRALGVGSLLEGSVRKAGDQLRITVQLIDVSDGCHIWSERYDRELRDVFEVQDEISLNIVKSLKLTLDSEDPVRLVEPRTDKAPAYDFYLRGRTFHRRWSKRNVEIAIRMFKQAISIDAYSHFYMYINSSEENLLLANENSEKALELEPSLAEAHASRGLALSLSRRYDEASEEFRQAIAADPNSFEAYYFFARNCVVQGDYPNAIHYYRESMRVSPDDYQMPILLAQVFHSLGNHQAEKVENRRGLALAEKAILLNPEDARACYMGAGAMVRLGQIERGLKWADRALALDPDDPAILYNVACSYASVDRHEDAIDCLERTVTLGASYKVWMENDSDLDPLRDHPRFQALVESLE